MKAIRNKILKNKVDGEEVDLIVENAILLLKSKNGN